MKFYIKNIWMLFIRLLTVFFIYQACRILYFTYNLHYFQDIDLSGYLHLTYGSIKFDISAILYLNILLILLSLIPSRLLIKKWYKQMLSYLFVVINSFGILLNIIDVFYYPFAKNRFTVSSIKEFSNENNTGDFLTRFTLDYWYVIPIILIIVYILHIISNRTQIKADACSFKVKPFLGSIILMLFLFTLTVFGCRGSFIYKNRPITISNAGKYTNSPNEISLVINTPFSLIRTSHLDDLTMIRYFTEKELDTIYPVEKQYKNNQKNGKNVVVIILESMSSEYFQFYNREVPDYEGHTPFLDSLLEYSYSSFNSFANGKKSIDAIPSILASIPPVQFNFALSKYCTNNIEGIGSLLRKERYSTSFYHGAPNGSMGFESMTKICGFDNYYGMNEYGTRKDFDGLWGIWDHKFLDFYADGLNQMQEPFVSSVFTITSHHPYEIPKEYRKNFPKEKEQHPMYNCVKYTDYSLSLFFKKVKQESWYENTLFVITADHTNYSKLKKYKNSIGIFRVPIIFFDPANPGLCGTTKQIVQHTDILPSILYYLGYGKSFISFGKNIFNSESNESFSINYNNNFQLITNDYVFIFDPELHKITKVFNHNKAEGMKTNMLNKIDPNEVERASNKIKGFIQQYNNRMINNKMTHEN